MHPLNPYRRQLLKLWPVLLDEALHVLGRREEVVHAGPQVAADSALQSTDVLQDPPHARRVHDIGVFREPREVTLAIEDVQDGLGDHHAPPFHAVVHVHHEAVALTLQSLAGRLDS